MKKLSTSMTKNELRFGLVYIAVQIFVLPALLAQFNLLLDNPLSPVQLNFALFCVDFICVTIIFHRFLWQGIRQVLDKPFLLLRSAGLGFLLYWIGSIAVNMVIYAAYPNFSNVNDTSISVLTQQNWQLMSIGTVLLVPVTEETLYRGLVFGNLYKRSRIGAYVLSTLIFAALHVVGYIGLYEPVHLLLCFLQYIPAGLSLALAYSMADTIWAPILMHITINQIGVLAMR